MTFEIHFYQIYGLLRQAPLTTCCIFLCGVSLAMILWMEWLSLLIDIDLEQFRKSFFQNVRERTVKETPEYAFSLRDVIRKSLNAKIEVYKDQILPGLKLCYSCTALLSCIIIAILVLSENLNAWGMWSLAIVTFPLLSSIIYIVGQAQSFKNDNLEICRKNFSDGTWRKLVQLRENKMAIEKNELPPYDDLKKRFS